MAPPPPPRKSSRTKLLLAAGALGAIVAVAVVLVIVLSGGGTEEASSTGTQPADVQTTPTVTTDAADTTPSETTPSETTPAEAPTPAPLPQTENNRVAAAPDALIISDPDGRVATLDLGTLDQIVVLADPALPSAVATSGAEVLVADEEAITVYESTDLVPKGAVSFGPGAYLATAGGTVVAARQTGQAGGRLCVLSDLKLDPCLDLAFRPVGLGVTSDGSGVLVANAAEDPALVPFDLEGGRLVEQNWIRLDAKPTGAPVEFRGSAYIPVEGGVAIADLDAGSVSSVVALPATPAAVTVVAGNGNLFAALPGTDQVALVDTLALDEDPRLISVGKLPAALTSTADVVYAINTGDKTITRLDALTGDALGTERVPALARERFPEPATATAITMEESSDAVTATIELEGGPLPASSIIVRNDGLPDGKALVELWQGGITTTAADQTLADLTVAIEHQSGRLAVTVTAPGGAFESFEARRSANGKAVTLVATKTPPPAETTDSSSSSDTSSSDTPEPAPAPEPEPEPGITVG
jgi:hypothetical protein